MVTAVQHFVREVARLSGEKVNEMQKDALRQIALERLKEFRDVYIDAVNNAILGTQPYREMVDALFNDLESQIDEVSSGAEVAVAIEDFMNTYKDQLKGLTSSRVRSMLLDAMKATSRKDAKRFISKVKKNIESGVDVKIIETIAQMQKKVKKDLRAMERQFEKELKKAGKDADVLRKQIDDLIEAQTEEEQERVIKKLKADQKGVLKNLGKYTNVVADVAMFTAVDPEVLAEDPTLFQKYLDAISDLSQNGTKATGKMQALLPEIAGMKTRQKQRKVTGMSAVVGGITTVSQLRDFVDEAIASITTLDELKTAMRNFSMIAQRARELKDEAIANNQPAVADDLEDFLDTYLPTKLGTNTKSQQLQGIIKQLKDQIVKAVKASPVNISALPQMYNDALKEFDSWSEEDLMRLDPAQLLTYQNVKNELKNGYIAPQLYDLNNKIASLKKAADMQKGMAQATSKYANMKSWKAKASKRIASLSTTYTEDAKQELLTIAKQYWDDLLGTQETRTFWRNILYSTSKSFVEAQKVTEQDLSEISTAIQDAKSNFRRWVSEKDSEKFKIQKSKLGLIMAQMDYEANTPGWNEFSNTEKNYFTEALKKNQDVPKEKQKIDEKAYAELAPFIENGYLNAQKAIASLSAEEKRIYDAFRNMTDSTQNKVKLMMEKRGEVYKEQKYYYPRNVLTDAKAGADEQINSILSMFGVGGGKVSTRAGATQKRTGAVNYYNFDIEEVANRHARQVNLDYYVTDQVKRSLSALTTLINQAREEGDVEKLNTLYSIRKSVEESLKAELGSQVQFRTTFNSMINTLTKAERNMTLSNPVRVFTEGLSNAVRTGDIPAKITMKQLADAMPILPSAMTSPYAVQWDNITDELGSSVYLKGSKFSMEARDVAKTSFAKMNNMLMQFADAVNAKQLWVNEFSDSFKKTTGIEFDPSRFDDPIFREKYAQAIETAAQDAELQVNRMYNSQTGFNAPAQMQLVPRTVAGWFGKTGKVGREDTAAKLMGYMNSFAANESSMSKMLIKSIIEGNDTKAAGQLARLIASNYVFTLLTTLASGAMKGAFDADDDDDLEERLELIGESAWAPFQNGAAWKGGVSTLLSMGIGKYANLFRLASGIGMGIMQETSEGKDYQETTDKIVDGIRDILYVKPIILSSEKETQEISLTMLLNR